MNPVSRVRRFEPILALVVIASMLLSVGLVGLLPGKVMAAPAANLDQIRNGAADDPWDPAEWVNGNYLLTQTYY